MDSTPIFFCSEWNDLFFFFYLQYILYITILFICNVDFIRYKWSRVVYFYERNGFFKVAGEHTCHLAMNTMAETFRGMNLTYASFSTDSTTTPMAENLRREVGLNEASELIKCVLLLLCISQKPKILNSTTHHFLQILLLLYVHPIGLFAQQITLIYTSILYHVLL